MGKIVSATYMLIWLYCVYLMKDDPLWLSVEEGTARVYWHHLKMFNFNHILPATFSLSLVYLVLRIRFWIFRIGRIRNRKFFKFLRYTILIKKNNRRFYQNFLSMEDIFVVGFIWFMKSAVSSSNEDTDPEIFGLPDPVLFFTGSW